MPLGGSLLDGQRIRGQHSDVTQPLGKEIRYCNSGRFPWRENNEEGVRESGWARWAAAIDDGGHVQCPVNGSDSRSHNTSRCPQLFRMTCLGRC